MSVVGQSVPRIDAVKKVKGKALFPGDYNRANQAYMKILFADRPHAIIHSLETSAAEAMPGVLAVLTAKDVPVNEYGQIIMDQPVLCGPGSDKPYADRVRFIGDQVALVIAESEKIATEALKHIKVDYEDLPVVADPIEGMKNSATLLHPDKESNVLCHQQVLKGSVEEAFAEADVIVEGEYQTPFQEHAYLQPEAGIGYIDELGRVTVLVGGQWTHEDRREIAHALDLPEDRVRVIYPMVGGAFGGREDMSVQIVLGLAAYRLHQRGIDRPVKIIWSRQESIVGHCKRHRFIIRTKWGATKDGKVIAVDAELIEDGGAYAYTSTTVLGNAAVMITCPYEIPNVKIDSYAVYTNNNPGGAFRGFGGPQAGFVAEGQMNKLAEKLGMDPVEIRARNVLTEGALLSVGTALPAGVTIGKVVEKAAKVAGWKITEHGWKRPSREQLGEPTEPHLKRGIGFACGLKNVGFSYGFPEVCTAILELHGSVEIEEVVMRHAAAEVGQGAHSAILQMTADAVGVPIEKVRLIPSDTATAENAGSVSASRMTFMAGNAIRGAAEEVLKKWNKEERPAIATYVYHAPKTTPFDPETGECYPNLAYGYVAETVTVEVDTETGHIRLLNVVCADDVGKAVNLQQVQGQIEGCVVQAAGWTILENFIQNGGDIKTRDLSTYLIPTVLDIPEKVESVVLEYADPDGPWGARGMGEMPFIPLAPAVTAAVRDATGVWFDEFPLTPEHVLKGIKKFQKSS